MRRPGRRNARSPQHQNLAGILRSLGATADFDPAAGASDNGTASSWTDRIGGYAVASTSQATRLVYSASLSGLNGRPGWTGTAANLTKLVSSDGVLAGLMDGAQALTVYQARKWATGTGVALWGCGSTANGHVMSAGANTAGVAYAQRYDGASTTHSGSVTGTDLKVDSYVFSGTTLAMWSNAAVTIASAANVRAPTCNRFTIGAKVTAGVYDSHFDGLIGRVVIFLSAHNDTQRAYVQSLLMSHYGVT